MNVNQRRPTCDQAQNEVLFKDYALIIIDNLQISSKKKILFHVKFLTLNNYLYIRCISSSMAQGSLARSSVQNPLASALSRYNINLTNYTKIIWGRGVGECGRFFNLLISWCSNLHNFFCSNKTLSFQRRILKLYYEGCITNIQAGFQNDRITLLKYRMEEYFLLSNDFIYVLYLRTHGLQDSIAKLKSILANAESGRVEGKQSKYF